MSDVELNHTEVYELLKLCVENTYTVDEIELFLNSKVESLLFHLNGGNAIVFGAFEGETLCGFVWAYPYTVTTEETIHIAYLAVFSQFRKHGIARRLLAEVEQIAREMGICTMEVIVSNNNDVAGQTYSSAGFTVDRKVMVKRTDE